MQALQATLLAALAATACGTSDPVVDRSEPAHPAPSSVEAFIEAQSLPSRQRAERVATFEGGRIEVYEIEYGEPQDCPAGCFYSSGYILAYEQRAGWLQLDEDPFYTRARGWFGLEGDDDFLFASELMPKSGADLTGWPLMFAHVAVGDGDVPDSVLLSLAALASHDTCLGGLAAKIAVHPRASQETLATLSRLDSESCRAAAEAAKARLTLPNPSPSPP